MAHTIREQELLLDRVRALRGRTDGIETLLEERSDCGKVLRQHAAAGGALDGLTAEILQDHIRFHVADPDLDPESEQAEATEQLVDLVHSDLR